MTSVCCDWGKARMGAVPDTGGTVDAAGECCRQRRPSLQAARRLIPCNDPGGLAHGPRRHSRGREFSGGPGDGRQRCRRICVPTATAGERGRVPRGSAHRSEHGSGAKYWPTSAVSGAARAACCVLRTRPAERSGGGQGHAQAVGWSGHVGCRERQRHCDRGAGCPGQSLPSARVLTEGCQRMSMQSMNAHSTMG